MPEQTPASDRFKAETPHIPGVPLPGAKRSGFLGKMSSATRLVLGLLIVLVLGGTTARWFFRPRAGDAPAPEPAQQIDLPTPPSDLNPIPSATEAHPAIATTAELAPPWSSKNFYFRKRLTGENIPALVIRLPGGSASQASSYWAFQLQVPFGSCQFEFLTDLDKIQRDYGFRAKHPMVGDPCSRTLFDPLKLSSLPGGAWVRGAVVQGSAIRPPLGIEIEIRENEVLATRME
jgi:hypothetical protein